LHWNSAERSRRRQRRGTSALISLVYRLAIRNGKVEEHLARRIQHKTEHNKRLRFLSVDEAKHLRPAISGKFPERLHVFELALQTGVRLGEQYGARWEHADCERHQLVIPRDKGSRTS
jgi:integrase